MNFKFLDKYRGRFLLVLKSSIKLLSTNLISISLDSIGGQDPNIVSDKAVCKFYIRALDRKYLNEVTSKIINCAKGAELIS